MSQQEECQSTPALMQALDRLDSETVDATSSLNSIPENNLLESYTRLSISLEDNGLFKGASVHERQAARMKTRSEWFLSPSVCSGMTCVDVDRPATPFYILEGITGNMGASAHGEESILNTSQESLKHPLVRRTSSKDKDRRLVRRSSSKKNKENGTSSSSSCGSGNRKQGGCSSPATSNCPSNELINHGGTVGGSGGSTGHNSPASSKGGGGVGINSPSKNQNVGQTGSAVVEADAASGGVGNNESDYLNSSMVLETDCTETDVQTFHVTLTYKPRI